MESIGIYRYPLKPDPCAGSYGIHRNQWKSIETVPLRCFVQIPWNQRKLIETAPLMRAAELQRWPSSPQLPSEALSDRGMQRKIALLLGTAHDHALGGTIWRGPTRAAKASFLRTPPCGYVGQPRGRRRSTEAANRESLTAVGAPPPRDGRACVHHVPRNPRSLLCRSLPYTVPSRPPPSKTP